MKHYIKNLLLLGLLSASTPALAMEKHGHQQESRFLEDLGLPNEIWTKIIEHVYLDVDYFFNLRIIAEAQDIYDAINIIEKHLQKYYLKILLVCKTFKNSNISKKRWNEFRKEIRKLYIPHLNQKFLEQRFLETGVYPKDGKWSDNSTNDHIGYAIAILSKGIESQNYLLCNFIQSNLEPKLINVLLFYGFDPNYRNYHGDPLLHVAILTSTNTLRGYSTDNIKLLVQYGADVNATCNNSRTALSFALLQPHKYNKNNNKIINFLLQHNANPNIEDANGESTLHLAVFNHHPNYQNNLQAIELLLKHGANPNSKMRDHTVLARALYLHNLYLGINNTELIKLLLQYNADPNIKNAQEKTAFDIADEQCFDLSKLIEKPAPAKANKFTCNIS